MQILTLAKRGLLSSLAFLSLVAFPDTISRIHEFSDGDILTAAQLNSEFDNVVDGVNSITNDNIASGAAISPAKISSSIAGSGITRNTSTGQLTPTVDGTTIEIGGSGLNVIANSIGTAQISSAVSGAALAENGTAIDVQVDGSTIEVSSDALRVKDGGITQAKRAALGQQISSSSGSFSTLSTSYVDVTNLSVTLTTIGRPVFVGMIADETASGNTGHMRTGSTANVSVQLLEDGVGVSRVVLAAGASFTPCSSFYFVAVPSAASHTYKMQMKHDSAAGGSSASVLNCKLVAYEL